MNSVLAVALGFLGFLAALALQSVGGPGIGDGPVALALTTVIFCLDAYLAITRRGVPITDRAFL